MVSAFSPPDQIPSVFWRTDVWVDIAGVEETLPQIVTSQVWVQQQTESLLTCGVSPLDIGKDVCGLKVSWSHQTWSHDHITHFVPHPGTWFLSGVLC